MDKQIAEKMFDNAVHIGHHTQKWNPRMKKFLYGEMDGIHIINLEKTIKYFEEAISFMSKLFSEGKIILFVSTKPQTVKIVEELANSCSMPYVTVKWIPGLLTNYSTIKRRIKYLADLKEQESSGEFEKYTKKEASSLRKTIEKLETSLGGVQNLKSMPDAVFVVDVYRDEIVVKEANKLGIPVVGLVDSNSDPSLVDYPIPANDDALKSLGYLLKKIEESLKKKPAKTKK
ncbi:30S ribosomal protein S2 [Candidatus Peregrinibacteria bacterium]|nr:30S ribosomal protein S2 [Candidatus Peregrinibacteria bacterium]